MRSTETRGEVRGGQGWRRGIGGVNGRNKDGKAETGGGNAKGFWVKQFHRMIHGERISRGEFQPCKARLGVSRELRQAG